MEKDSSAPQAAAVEVLKADDAKPGSTATPGQKYAAKVSLLELFKYADTWDWCLIAIGCLFAAADGASVQITIIYFGEILGALVMYTGTPESVTALNDTVTKSVIYMVVIGACTFLAAFVHTWAWTISGENQARRIREFYFRSLIRQDTAWYDANSTGELTTRLTADLNLIQDGISSKPGVAIKSIVAFITGFVIAFTKGWQLALVLTACFPAIAGVVVLMSKIRSGGSERAQKAYAGAGNVAQQALASIRTVHAFGGEQKEINKYSRQLESAEKIGIRTQLLNGCGLGSLQGVIFCVYALAFWYGNKLVPGTLNAGGVLNVLFAILIGSFSLGGATAMGAAKIIYSTIDRTSPIDPLSEKGERPEKVNGDIKFVGIDFHYPSRPDVPILKGFSLDIGMGQTVALVGASGSGKSTIVKLFERFYNPTGGMVTLDGKDISTLNVNWLRQQIGMVSQEPVLFDTTIRQNILYGLPNFKSYDKAAQDAKIEEACRQANCWDFIQRLPKQLETSVGESGGMMSGGQKQRIAIARAIIKNPPILLLDEATSALDTESERIVQEALEVASKNRTTIVIAHRLSTIKSADHIVVMEKGEIKESGTHNSLLALGKIYADLVATQSLKGTVEGAVKERVLAKQRAATEAADTKTAEKELSDEEKKLEMQKKAAAIKLNYARLFKWSQPELVLYIIASIGAVINGSVQPLFAVLFSSMLTALGSDRANTYALLFALLGVGAFISNFMQNLFVVAGEKITRRLRFWSFQAILKQDIAYFDDEENSTGALMSKLAEDASLVPGLTGQTFGAIVQGLGGVFGGLIIAFIASWQLALLILAMVPVIGFAGYMQFRTLTGSGSKTKQAYEQISQQASEAISSIRTIMTITQEQHFLDNFNATILIPHNATKDGAVVTSLSVGFASSIGLFCWAVSMLYGAQLLKWNLYSPDNVLRALFSVLFVAQSLGQVANFMPDAARGKVAAVAIFELLDRVPKIDVTIETGETRESVSGKAAIRQVKFAYPTRPTTMVLKGLNVEANPGMTVALVGKSGCGKSTVMGLLERWYDPLEGVVSLDDIAVSQWNLKKLRSFLSIVGQEPVLFNVSVRENIAYGSLQDNPDDLSIYEAAKLANIHDFVMSLPDKYDTLVGEKGGQLSGGQKQRIAIARALVRNPRLLLLDEATSALDSESEHVVQAALDAAAKGRTTIVIAHRLSTIQNADKILVVENGVIAEWGTHLELVDKNGIYADLVRQQQLGAN
ncbi:Multidrug resistance protein 1 [Kappamyces sp. JEL0680]|nr:Multidrug resistance protein 1 [Kappamyces sp. JEL0680]